MLLDVYNQKKKEEVISSDLHRIHLRKLSFISQASSFTFIFTSLNRAHLFRNYLLGLSLSRPEFMFIPTRSILQINLLIEYWCFFSKKYHKVLVRKLWVTLIASLGQEVCQNQKVCDREWEASEVVEATLESESLRPICVQIDIFSFLFPFLWELYFKGLNIGCFMRTLYRE